jgi:rhodanese-related sulfurtransferase
MPNLEQCTAPELAERLKSAPSPVVVDVREPWEIALAPMPGAIAIPLGELVRRFEELDPEAQTVLVCHHGYRSMQAAMFLANQGFEHVVNLRGGIEAWAELVDPSCPRY